MMAEVGSIKLNVRLRIEAGIGKNLTDVGHADMELALPVQMTAVASEHGAGAAITIDTTALTARLTEAVAAFESTAQG